MPCFCTKMVTNNMHQVHSERQSAKTNCREKQGAIKKVFEPGNASFILALTFDFALFCIQMFLFSAARTLWLHHYRFGHFRHFFSAPHQFQAFITDGSTNCAGMITHKANFYDGTDIVQKEIRERKRKLRLFLLMLWQAYLQSSQEWPRKNKRGPVFGCGYTTRQKKGSVVTIC